MSSLNSHFYIWYLNFMCPLFEWLWFNSFIRGSHLGAFCPYAIVYWYLEFKLRSLKNLKLFSIRVKELFEPIVLRRKGDGFLLLLKAFSWETDLWVTLGDFTVKNVKLGREICIELKINWVEMKHSGPMWQIFTIVWVTYAQKDF